MDSPARILIVDDDDLMRTSMRRVLESSGYGTQPAETGGQALALLHEGHFDLVLLDVNMPDMDGFEVCRRIKSDPALAGVPVIILSGSAIASDNKAEGLNLGADDYLTRPTPNRELLARIHAVLRVKKAEDALRRREKQLQDLISANIDGILVLDPQGSVQLANSAACQLLNRTLDELQGSRLDFAVPAGGDAEIQIDLPGGGTRILELRSTQIQWQEAPASLLSLRDITRPRQAEMQLRESEEKYRLLTENIRDVVWVMDAETLRFQYVSPSVQRLRGYTPEEILAEPMDAALSPQGAVFVRGLMQRDVADFLAGKISPDHFFVNEVDQPCKDGSTVWTEVITSYYKNERNGRVEVLGVTRDITERRRVENALRESEKRYADTLNAVRDGVWDWFVQSGEFFVSKNYYILLGYEENEIKPSYAAWRSLVHREDLKNTKEIIQASIDSGEPFSIDLRMRMKSGEWRWFSMRGGVVERQADGRVLRLLGTLSDISSRKLAEEQLREARLDLEKRVDERTAQLISANQELEKASRLKDEFLASMSHELRTPLTGILGLAQVLQMQTYGTQTEKQLHALQNIEASGRHLLELINDILDYSRIEAGKMELHLTPCSLVEICQSSLQAIVPLAQRKQQQTSFTSEPPFVIVAGDVRRLKQVMIDLLSNAVKFTPQGGSLGIEISLIAPGQSKVEQEASEDAEQVYITVWDTGIGIHLEDISRLFEPFTQLDARLERQYSGTGLGLSLVKRLVELHGGSVSVVSDPGKGSRFTVSLPLIHSVDNAAG
jgi:PAS domain S-box-containing protein